MKVYISLPITGQDPDEVEAQATFAAGVLEKKGHTAVSPLEICDPDWDYITCMGACIQHLLRCDAMVVLEGWSCSKGWKPKPPTYTACPCIRGWTKCRKITHCGIKFQRRAEHEASVVTR